MKQRVCFVFFIIICCTDVRAMVKNTSFLARTIGACIYTLVSRGLTMYIRQTSKTVCKSFFLYFLSVFLTLFFLHKGKLLLILFVLFWCHATNFCFVYYVKTQKSEQTYVLHIVDDEMSERKLTYIQIIIPFSWYFCEPV